MKLTLLPKAPLYRMGRPTEWRPYRERSPTEFRDIMGALWKPALESRASPDVPYGASRLDLRLLLGNRRPEVIDPLIS